MCSTVWVVQCVSMYRDEWRCLRNECTQGGGSKWHKWRWGCYELRTRWAGHQATCGCTKMHEAGHALNDKEAAVGRCVAAWWRGHMGDEGKVRQAARVRQPPR